MTRYACILLVYLLALCSCRAPDQITVTPGYGWTEADFARGLDQSYEGESYGIYLGFAWDWGERRATRNEGAERESRMETLGLAHASHAGVVINTGSEGPGSTEDEEGLSLLTKALAAVGALLAALGGTWEVRRRRRNGREATEEE